jgi:hypothetical protein
MSIYCKDCSELITKINKFGVTSYCKKFNEYLREVPMDNNIIKYPIKCLECINQENKKRLNYVFSK